MKNSLINTNPYLKNAAEREAMLYTSVVTSSAIEGVKVSKTPGKSTKKKKR